MKFLRIEGNLQNPATLRLHTGKMGTLHSRGAHDYGIFLEA